MSPDRSRRREWFTGRGAFDDLARAVALSQGGGEWAVTAALLAAPLIALSARVPALTLAVGGGFAAAALVHARKWAWARLGVRTLLWASSVVMALSAMAVNPVEGAPVVVTVGIAWGAFGVALLRPRAQGVGAAALLAICALGLWTADLAPPRLFAEGRVPTPLVDLVLGVGLIAAFLAVVCRRARTMTAVPLDHPICVDFGGPVASPVSPGGSGRSGSTSPA